jgi:hypothetical protein
MLPTCRKAIASSLDMPIVLAGEVVRNSPSTLRELARARESSWMTAWQARWIFVAVVVGSTLYYVRFQASPFPQDD